MKPNVLLAGGSGYIGKYISSVIEKRCKHICPIKVSKY